MEKSTKGAEEVVDKPIEEAPPQPVRQIVIETDGTNIHLVKAEVGGKIELIAIFQNLINYLSQAKQ